MATALAEYAATETYRDTVKLIWKCIHNFQRQYGTILGTREELLSLANDCWWDAYTSYHRDSACQFSTWLVSKIKYGLAERLRTCLIQKSYAKTRKDKPGSMLLRLPEVPHDAEGFPQFDAIPARHSFCGWFHDLLDSLSDDAQSIARLVADMPDDLAEVLRFTPGSSAGTVRRGLTQYLAGLGWSVERIRESFAEITKAISE